ncbi:MAG: DinB family protein [Nitrososphaerales archaeon]|jgi:uncharacterized damage-inducible protein DinB
MDEKKKEEGRTAGELVGELASLREFFAYNVFVRRKYLDFMGGLPEETLTKDRGASYPSILDIQTHILDVCRSWLHASETGEDSPELRGLTLAQVKELEAEVDDYAERFMRRLRPEDLEGSFQFTPGKGGGVVTIALREMLWHMVEEELQHRGELNALLWQDDIDPPVTDWIDWKRALEKPGGR